MIKDIIENNSYPIVFIGSGMSKRYLENFPTWDALLKEYWEQIKESISIFQFKRSLKKSEIPETTKELEKDFLVNVKTATYIQQRFDDLFYDGIISVEGLTYEEAYSNDISPFKYSIAQRFSKYKIKDEMRDEIYRKLKLL